MIPGLRFEKLYELDQFIAGLAKTAEIMDAEYDGDLLKETLTVFREPFESGAVSYRMTTLPGKTKINARYMDFRTDYNAFEIALEHGLIPDDGHPGNPIISFAGEQFGLVGDQSGYAVDIGLGTGLEKVWIFFQDSEPFTEIAKIPDMPESVGDSIEFLASLGMTRAKVLGVDYVKKSVNLYTMPWEIGGMDTEKAAALISHVGSPRPSDEVLRTCTLELSCYLTYNWTEPDIQRACFVTVAPAPMFVPTHWDPAIDKFVKNAVSISDERIFFYNPTFARNHDDYHKIEICFHKGFADMMMSLCPPGYPEEWQKKLIPFKA